MIADRQTHAHGDTDTLIAILRRSNNTHFNRLGACDFSFVSVDLSSASETYVFCLFFQDSVLDKC